MDSNTNDFKSFFADRPVIKSIVFYYISPQVPSGFHTNLYHGASDGTNFFLREIRKPEEAAKRSPRGHAQFCGRYGGNDYVVDDGLVIQSSPATNNPGPLRQRVLGGEVVLEACLNMGLWDAGCRSFVWHGSAFTAHYGLSSKAYQVKIIISGKDESYQKQYNELLDQRSRGFTGKVRVVNGAIDSLEFDNYPIVIHYDYARKLAYNLPGRIRVTSSGQQTGVFEILSLETQKEPLDAYYFSPELYIERSSHVAAVINDKGMIRIPDEHSRLSYFNELKRREHVKDVSHPKARYFTLFILALITTGPIILYFAWIKTNQTTKYENTNKKTN